MALEGARWVLSNRLSRLFSTPVQVKGFFFSLQNHSVTLRELTFDIAGVPLQAQGRLNVTAQAHAAARCEGWMNLRHPLLTGYLEVSGKSTEPVLLGWLATPRGVQRRFLAQLSIRPEGMTLTQMEVEGGWRAWGVFAMKGKFQVEGPGNRFTLEVEPGRRENGRLSLLLERKEDLQRRLTVDWALRRNALNFEAAFLEEARLSGRMELNAPHQMEITLELSGVEMEELFHPFFKRGVSPISGQMKGEVKVAGTPAHLISHGTLTSRDGKFYQTPFTWAAVRFSGVGPVLKIQNSQLTKPTGVLLIEGSVDLRQLGHPDFFSQVQLSWVQSPLELAGLSADG